MGEAMASSGNARADFAQTRDRITKACATNQVLRDNPNQIPEAAHFLSLLDEKDRYFFILQLHYADRGEGNGQALDRVLNSGDSYDGGIPPVAAEAWSIFMKSANSSRTNIDHPDVFLQTVATPSNPEQVLVSEQFRRYLILRNMYELNALDCNITSDPDQLWRDALFAARPWGHLTIREHVTESEMTERYFAALNRHFTVQVMRNAALAVINTHRDTKGLIEIPLVNYKGPVPAGKVAHYSLTTYGALQSELRGPGPGKYRYPPFGGVLDEFGIEQLEHLPPSE